MNKADLKEIRRAWERFLLRPDFDDAQRIFHGRGGCYPGWQWCNIDSFYPHCVISCFQAPPPGFAQTMANLFDELLRERGFTHLLLQHRYENPIRFEFVRGEEKEFALIKRGPLKFIIQFKSRNLGYFLDMEPGRHWLEARAQGKKVLNLFAYTCAFSVVARAAGAEQVINVDMSRSALRRGRENHHLNRLGSDDVQFLPLNILKSWKRIKKYAPFDIIICDPPSYQKGSFIAERDYDKLIKKLPELGTEGTDVLACLNAPELPSSFLLSLFQQHAPHCEYQQRLALPSEFRDRDEERQLKLLHYRC